MKNQPLYILVLLAFALIACQKNEIVEENAYNDGTVKYDVVFGQPDNTRADVEENGVPTTFLLSNETGEIISKGSLINTSGSDVSLSSFAETVGSFVSEAYDATGEKLISQTVSWSGSKWVGSPVAYWPQATKLDFLAYANLLEGETASIGPDGVTLEHTVPSEAADQKDILFGHYQGDGGNTGTAQIRFEHPLTAVRFVRGSMEAELVIAKISLEGVAESGIASMAPDGTISWTEVESHEYTVTQEAGDNFILIPQNLAVNNVKVAIEFTNGKTAEALIESGEWKAGFTNTYTISSDSATSVSVFIHNEVHGSVMDNLTIANNGVADAYLRAAITGCWVDSSDDIVAPWNMAQGSFANFPGDDWVLNESDGFYYYVYPVKGTPDPETPVATGTRLFSAYTAPESPVANASFKMNIIVQGVRYDKDKKNVAEAWGAAAAGLLNEDFK